MNGYDLTKNWYSFRFQNTGKVKAIHSDMFFYIIYLWNRLGQKNEFGLPTDVSMEALEIGSYNTYKKALNTLVEFGFIKIVKESKNQYQSKIIALSKTDKATDKALDKASVKATDESVDKSLDSIIEYINIKTIKLINTQPKEFCDFVNNNHSIIFKEEKKEVKIIELKNLNDFEKKVSEYFSQTTEVLKMRLSGYLRSLQNQGKLEEFVKQTLAYIEYKKISGEKTHSWNGYMADWESSDWIDKFQKIKKIEVKTEKKVHSNR
jgi:hypothetical protein